MYWNLRCTGITILLLSAPAQASMLSNPMAVATSPQETRQKRVDRQATVGWQNVIANGLASLGLPMGPLVGRVGSPQLASASPSQLLPPRIESLEASSEKLGMTTFLDAEGTDPDGNIVRWDWDFDGDGFFDQSSGMGPGAFFVYPTSGQYSAKLRITDNHGLKDQAVVNVIVEPASKVTVTDVDGNVYQTVRLGNQTWMIENLKTTSFNDGESITENFFPFNWSTPFGQFQWADTSDLPGMYDPELPEDYYGAVYNEAALASGRLAPTGWRIPSEADWLELIAFLAADGFSGMEGSALKSTFGWSSFSGNGLDAYGFKGLPGGYVSAGGSATGAPVIATWATSNTPTPLTRLVANLFDGDEVLFFENSNHLGAAVRCIKE